MWKLRTFCLLCGLWVFSLSGSVLAYSQEDDGPYSKRMAVYDCLDDCLFTIYEIKSGEISQEQGLNKLENMIEIIQFMTWYWIED